MRNGCVCGVLRELGSGELFLEEGDVLGRWPQEADRLEVRRLGPLARDVLQQKDLLVQRRRPATSHANAVHLHRSWQKVRRSESDSRSDVDGLVRRASSN